MVITAFGGVIFNNAIEEADLADLRQYVKRFATT